MVGREVAAHPPWSMATSTITAPARIRFTMPSVIRRGARAPGSSTAPITRSASTTACSRVSGLEYRVRSFGPNREASDCNTFRLRSSTVTEAPNRSAMSTALRPTTPPPITVTSAGEAPGTPPSSMPRPPAEASRHRAPACTDILPATRDMGARSGSRPRLSVTDS